MRIVPLFSFGSRHLGACYLTLSCFTNDFFMKRKNVLFSALAIMLSLSVSAQAVTSDSITVLKQQKEAIAISKRINDNKIKLAKLQNTVGKAEQNVQTTGDDAQKSANTNGAAADKLTTDAENKKLAGDASKSAKEAKHDAKQARKASANLENLRKDIESLKSKIAADESSLSAISDKNSNNIPASVPGVPKN
jgi:predicted  nucleic acid-binding Zn-ribbon protein